MLEVASTVIHLDKSRAARDVLLGMKGPVNTRAGAHATYAGAPGECGPSVGGRRLKAPKAVFTFIYGSCRLNPAPLLPSDGTLQTNYRGRQKKTVNAGKKTSAI